MSKKESDIKEKIILSNIKQFQHQFIAINGRFWVEILKKHLDIDARQVGFSSDILVKLFQTLIKKREFAALESIIDAFFKPMRNIGIRKYKDCTLPEEINIYLPFEKCLIEAASTGNTDALKILLKDVTGLDPNTYHFHGGNALMTACHRGHSKAIAFLLSKGADPNIKDKNQRSALSYAVVPGVCIENEKIIPIPKEEQIKYAGVIQMLLSKNADSEIIDESGRTISDYVFETGNLQAAIVLLKQSAKLKNNFGKMLLQTFIQFRNAAMLQEMIQVPEIKPLILSCCTENPVIFETLLLNALDTGLIAEAHSKYQGMRHEPKQEPRIDSAELASTEMHAKSLFEIVKFFLAIGIKPSIADLNRVIRGRSSEILDKYQPYADKVEYSNYAFSILKLILQQKSIDLNQYDDTFTPLTTAALSSRLSVMQSLLEAGADIDARNKDRSTALLFAVYEEQWTSVDFLLNAGASIDIKLPNGLNTLFFATLVNNYDVAERLLKAKADPNVIHSVSNYTPLVVAIMHQNSRLAQLLLDHGAIPQFLPTEGNISGEIATFLRTGVRPAIPTPKSVPEQLTSGADPKNGDPNSENEDEEIQTSETLILGSNGIPVKTQIGSIFSPLNAAARNGMPEVVKRLLETKEFVQIERKLQSELLAEALKLAAFNNQRECFDFIILLDTTYSFLRNNYKTLLEDLLEGDSQDYFELIFKLALQDLGVQGRDEEGRSLLMLAAAAKASGKVAFLIKQGAEVNAVTKDNWSPLHFACWGGDIQSVKLLLAAEASNDITNDKLETPFMIAVKNGYAVILKTIFQQRKVDLQHRNLLGLTALQLAGATVFELLVEFGAKHDNNDAFQINFKLASALFLDDLDSVEENIRFVDVNKPLIIPKELLDQAPSNFLSQTPIHYSNPCSLAIKKLMLKHSLYKLYPESSVSGIDAVVEAVMVNLQDILFCEDGSLEVILDDSKTFILPQESLLDLIQCDVSKLSQAPEFEKILWGFTKEGKESLEKSKREALHLAEIGEINDLKESCVALEFQLARQFDRLVQFHTALLQRSKSMAVQFEALPVLKKTLLEEKAAIDVLKFSKQSDEAGDKTAAKSRQEGLKNKIKEYQAFIQRMKSHYMEKLTALEHEILTTKTITEVKPRSILDQEAASKSGQGKKAKKKFKKKRGGLGSSVASQAETAKTSTARKSKLDAESSLTISPPHPTVQDPGTEQLKIDGREPQEVDLKLVSPKTPIKSAGGIVKIRDEARHEISHMRSKGVEALKLLAMRCGLNLGVKLNTDDKPASKTKTFVPPRKHRKAPVTIAEFVPEINASGQIVIDSIPQIEGRPGDLLQPREQHPREGAPLLLSVPPGFARSPLDPRNPRKDQSDKSDAFSLFSRRFF